MTTAAEKPPPAADSTADVLVMLATYNGAKYLDEQLSSIFSQVGVQVSVIARDDGSTDSTPQILDRWQALAALSWFTGSNLGPAASFMRLVADAPDASYYAFADQDDSWDSDKLRIAVDRLAALPSGTPALYLSAKRIVDESLRPTGATETPPPRISFGTALFYSAGSGCTMVFNRELLAVLKDDPHTSPGMHDHWAYKVCLAVGGTVVYDSEPHLAYRQHGANVISADESVRKRFGSWWRDARRRDRVGSGEAAAILARYVSLMPAENQEIARAAAGYRASFGDRIRLLRDRRFRTGRLISDAAFAAAVVAGSF